MTKNFHLGCAYLNSANTKNDLSALLHFTGTSFQGCVSRLILMMSRLSKLLQMWCSEGLALTCDNNKWVRVDFAFYCCDRESMRWVATTATIFTTDTAHGPFIN